MVNAATHVALDGELLEVDPAPDPSAVSVCAHCGAWLHYTEGGALRILTAFEGEHLPPETLKLMRLATTHIKMFNDLLLRPGQGKSR